MNKHGQLLLTALLFTLISFDTYADEYHGEFCWQVFSQSGEPYWKYKFGIYEKEGGHFTLLGSIDYGDNGISASHGNAVFIGDSVKLTIVSADHEEGVEVWAETFAAKLNKSTLDGNWHALTLEKKENERDVFGVYQRGSINSVDCS